MQITFKRKNKLVLDRTYPIDEGSTITENYNETLDSAVIRISHLTEPLDIEPFDKVVLQDEAVVYNESQTKYCEPYLYGRAICNVYIEGISLSDLISYDYEIIEGEEYVTGTPSVTTRFHDNIVAITFLVDCSSFSTANKIKVKIDYSYSIKKLADRYMCIDTYTETMESLDPVLYSYEIHLFSETKELEGVLLPNLSITQLSDGTNRKVWYYLNQYFELYCPKHYVSTVDGYDFFKKYSFSDRVQSKFNTIDCPEMQWNNPTLREVLNDLMMVGDCIVVMRNNIIDYIDLTEKKNAIDTDKVNYIQRSQSSEDYVSELKMNMLNVMQTSIPSVKDTSDTMEYLTFKPDDGGYVVTEENMCLVTQYPILKINHLWMTFQFNVRYYNQGSKAASVMYKVDLCNLRTTSNDILNLVFEKTKYNALPIRRYNPETFNEINQNIALYYTQGGNQISGFYNLSKLQWTWSNKITTLNLLKLLIVQNCLDSESNNNKWSSFNSSYLASAYSSWFSTFFTIEYETTADAVFQASKDIAPTHNRVIVDNQTYSFVDAYNQGFMEYQKANRLGNKQLFINARYENDYNDIIKIGDYYEDNIVFQTQYQIYEDHIEVNATATKDYILRDYFTGVKARIRSWKIADASQSFTRHELQKYYLEFSKDRKVIYLSESFNPYYFLSPIYSIEIKPLKYCFIRTYSYISENNYQQYPYLYNGYYAVELLGRIIGNSVVFTFGFDDNFTCGKKVADEILQSNIHVSYIGFIGSSDYTSPNDVFGLKKGSSGDHPAGSLYNYGGVPLEDTRYVDDNGEFEKLEFTFTYKIADDRLLPLPEIANNASTEYSGDDYQRAWMHKNINLPVVDNSTVVGRKFSLDDKLIYKDNREIFKMSIQFEMCSDTHDIVFTKKFLELQECIKNKGTIVQRAQVYTQNQMNFTQQGANIWRGAVTYQISSDDKYLYSEYSIFTGENYASVESISYDALQNAVTMTILTTADPAQNNVSIQFRAYCETLEKVIKVYRASNQNYNFKNTELPQDAVEGGSISINQTYPYSTKLEINSVPADVENYVFYICVNNEVVLMVNGMREFYLNLLLSREYAVYDLNGDIIGDIVNGID